MVPWYFVPISIVAAFIAAYAFHGTWKLIIREAKKQIWGDFIDVKARLDVLYEKAEGDIKAELGKIREAIRKVIP